MTLIDSFREYLLLGGEFNDFHKIYENLCYNLQTLPTIRSIISYIKKITLFDIQPDNEKFYTEISSNSGIAFIVYNSKLCFYIYKDKYIFKIRQIIDQNTLTIQASKDSLDRGDSLINIDNETKRYLFCSGVRFNVFSEIFVYYTTDTENYVYKRLHNNTYQRLYNKVTNKGQLYKSKEHIKIKLDSIIKWKKYLETGDFVDYEKYRNRFLHYKYFYMTPDIKIMLKRLVYNLNMLGYTECIAEIENGLLSLKLSPTHDIKIWKKSIVYQQYCMFNLIRVF